MVMNLVIAAIMLVIGVLLFTGKAAKYLKSYQNMEEKEKSNIKIGVLCKNISLLFFIAAVIFTVSGLSEVFRMEYFKWAMLGWFALGSADVIYIGRSKRFVHVYTPPVKEDKPFTARKVPAKKKRK